MTERLDRFLQNVLPVSMMIASAKMQLAEAITEHIISISKDAGLTLTKRDKEDIDVVIEEVISKLPLETFKIPLDLRPRSEKGIENHLQKIDEDTIKSIISKIVKDLKKRQTKIGEYL
ncbi:MAG: hypothetical protein QW177_08025 [Candidatus Nitrosotenuis sp.]